MKLAYRHLAALGVFLAAGSLSYLWWWQENQHTELARRSQLDNAVRETTRSIEQRMRSDEQVLRATQALLHLPGRQDRNNLRLFVESLQLGADFAGLDGVGVAEWVPADRLAAHTAAQRRAGLAGYVVRPEPLQQPRPAGAPARDVFAPVVQIEPASARNQRLVGADLHADPVLRLALETARDSGRAAISGKVWLASNDGTPEQAGFMMFLPLYAADPELPSVAARRLAITSWVLAPIRMNDLMASVFGPWVQGNDIRLYDGVQMTAETLLFDSSSAPRSGDAAAGWTAEYLVIAGRTWTLAVRPHATVTRGFGKQVADIIAFTGPALSLLLALVTWLLLTGRARLLSTATQMTAQLRETKDHFELIFNTSPDGVLIARLDNREILSVNDGLCSMTGYGRSDLVGKALDTMKLWQNAQEQQRFIQALSQHGACDNMEATIRTSNGESFVGIVSARIASFSGTPCFVGVVRDISARKEAEMRVAFLAQHDALTGLPNRALIADRLHQAIAQAKRDHSRLGLMYLDLDRFKPVNDTLGHAVGDLLLKAVALRVLECVRESDTVGRIGGDEFMVLLPNVKDAQDVLVVAEKVRMALNQPFVLEGGQRLEVSSSAGIAIYPDDAVDETELQKNADVAMYRAKKLGRDRVELFAPAETAT